MRNRQIYYATKQTASSQLSGSLSKELQKKYHKRSVRIIEGDTVKVVRGEFDGVDGKVTKVSLENNGINIEGACEGSMACSTCHVIVDSSWFCKLEPASEEEEDLLDLTLGLTACSRLGCQIVMTESLDGIIVTLPTNTNNIIGI